MVAASRAISSLHSHLVKTRDPNALRNVLLLLPSNCTPSAAAAAASTFSYARAIFADHAPAAHAFPWNAIIRAHALIPAYAPDALALFASMRRHGVPIDCYTLPLVLRASALHPSPPIGVRAGTSAHALAIKHGLLTSAVHACNAFIAFYGRHGRLGQALQLFDEMPPGERDVVSWSTLVASMASSGRHAEALEGFRLMQASGVSPDEPAMVSVAWAAGDLAAADLAAWAYCYTRRRRLRVTVPLGTALVAALARCGRINLAKKVFDEMPERNVVTWTAMIHGLAAHGRGPESLEAFRRMVGDGFEPDHVAFVGALTACSRGGLLEEGFRLFEGMERDHGVAPRREHYGCMVDLMGRAGLVAEARELVEGMPTEPGPVVWRTLLGACAGHGYVELAEQVKGRISELEPGRHDGDYVLLSNAYGGIGRWGEKEGVRSEMRGRRVRKTPGLSVTSL